MKYIIIAILSVLSISAMGQIEPYQIVNDVDGEHRILMTDANGEYIRVGLLDAVIDSIGIQLEQVGDSICIVGGNCIYNPTGGSQLTEAEVDAYADNNGYLEVEVDGSITNEIQDISLSGTDLSISSGSTIDLSSIDTDTNTQLTEAQVDAFADNNGYLETEVDGSITNELQTISKVGSTVTLSDGGGSFTDTDTNTQLTEAQVDAFADNNGYLETEIDGSITNEIQDISLSGSDLTISSGSTIDLSSIDTDTNTQLTEAQVDAYADNNGYLETEVDGSITNEIQTLTDNGATFSLSNSGGTVTKTVDTNTQLTESQVDAFADNNGYLETEVDGSITNEIQDISLSGSDLTISSGSTIDLSSIDTDTNTQLTEAEVDAYADNNGYLETEVDGSITNEIQDTSNIDGLLEFVQSYGGSGGKFIDGTDALDAVYLAGDVGIGTGDPATNLDISATQARMRLSSTRDATWVVGTPMSEIQFYSGDTSGSSAESIRAGIRTEAANSSGSDVQMVFQIKGDVSGFPTDAVIIQSDKDVQMKGGLSIDGNLYTDGTSTFNDDAQFDGEITATNTINADIIKVADRVGGAAVKGAFFDANNQLIEGTIITDTNTQLTEAQVDAYADNNGYNEVIGTDSDINTGGSYVVDQVFMTDGVVTSHTTRQLFQLESEDDRDLAPEDIEYSEDVKTYFTSKNGLDTGTSPNGDYQDAIVLNTWTDGSGGDANLLSFDKSEKKIYHYQADQAETNWGTPEVLAYVSDIPASGGKFVDGTDTDDAVYMDGNVGIGTDTPSTELAVNGTYSGEYPKDSGFNNVVFGGGNFSAMTIGTQNFVSGDNNGQTATSIYRSALLGLDNAQFASDINYTFSAGAYNNENNLTGCNYNFMNGYLNAREAQGLSYSFFSGRENAEDASQAGYSFYSGFQNLHSSTSATNYNFMSGRQNAYAAFDSDYSFIVGYRNVFAAAANLDFSFIAGLENAYNSAAAITSTTLIGSRNGYTTSGTLSHSTMIGFENGKFPTVALNNTILLGFRQGYSIGSEGAAAYRLAIGMIQDNPLIYGEFDNAVLKVNGNLTVTDRVGTPDKGAFFDANGMLVEGDIVTGIDSSLSKVDQNIIAADTRVVDVDGKLIMSAGETSSAGVVVSASSTISGDKYSALNANTSSTTSDGFYALETGGIRIRVGDEDEGRILYSTSTQGNSVWGQADNVGRITTTLSLWSDERQVLLAGTAYGSFGAFTFPPSGWTTSQQHDGDVLTFINRSGSTRELTGDIESTTSTTVDVLDDDTIRLVYYSGGGYWIVLSNN